MIIKIEIDLKDDSKNEAIHIFNASKYASQIETFYDECIRKHLKYGEPIIGGNLTQRDIKIVEKLMELFNEHFEI